MAQVTLRNPRVTATVDLELEGGVVVVATVHREATEEHIVQEIQTQVRAASARAELAGAAPLAVPTDEDLVPALVALKRLQDQPLSVE